MVSTSWLSYFFCSLFLLHHQVVPSIEVCLKKKKTTHLFVRLSNFPCPRNPEGGRWSLATLVRGLTECTNSLQFTWVGFVPPLWSTSYNWDLGL
ncbi:hypothetical protein BO71DRAFT_397996, partial [Aspergillus ellipticus CBS 707.79]